MNRPSIYSRDQGVGQKMDLGTVPRASYETGEETGSLPES